MRMGIKMSKKVKLQIFCFILLTGMILTTPLADCAYLAFFGSQTTNNYSESTSGQSPDIDSDHYLNRNAELNFELPKDMNFTGNSNSETYPNYNMHEDSVNWGSYLSPNTSIFESYDNSSVRTVEKYYKERWDFQKLLANTSDSITTMNFTDANNGTIEFDTLFSDNDEFTIALCQNETEIFYIKALLGSWRFYTIDGGQSGANPSVSSDTWFYVEMRWNRLGNIYFTCRGSQETPIPFGNYSINNIKFEISDNTEYMLLNGMNASIPGLNTIIVNKGIDTYCYREDGVFGKDNVLSFEDQSNTEYIDLVYNFDKPLTSGTITFDFIRNTTTTATTEIRLEDNGVGHCIILFLGGNLFVKNGSSLELLRGVSANVWYNIQLYFYVDDVIKFHPIIDSVDYGLFLPVVNMSTVNKLHFYTYPDTDNFKGSIWFDTEFVYANDTLPVITDFKIDTVQDYTVSEGWFPTRALTVNSSNHVNLTYDSVESWDYEDIHFETVVKIEDNSIFRMKLYEEDWTNTLTIEYFESMNFLSVDTPSGVFNTTTVNMNTDYPIWLSFSMIQQYTIVNGTYYDLEVVIASTFDFQTTSINTFVYKQFNFVGKHKFGLEFRSIGYTTTTIYAIDSNVILEYFPFTFVSGFLDNGYVENSIFETYKLHTDCYPTFDFSRYSVESSFDIEYSNGYPFDILDNSQTYKRREVKTRVLHTHVEDTLAIESYELHDNMSFNEDSFSFTTVFNMSLNYTVEIDMGISQIYMNFSEGVERDGFKVWFNGTTPISLSNPNYILPIVYLSVHKTLSHSNGLYFSVVLGSQYISKSINITEDVSRPIVNFYNFNPLDTDYYSNGSMEIYGLKLKTYNSDYELYRPKLPDTMAADLEFYGGQWFNPTGLLFMDSFTDSSVIIFTQPSLSTSLAANFSIQYAYITNVSYTSIITVSGVSEFTQTFSERRVGTNATTTDTNSYSTNFFEFYQFGNTSLNYTYNMDYTHPGNISIGLTVVHDILWLMYIIDTPLSILDLGLNMIAPFILMLIFPFAFYSAFGRMGAMIGFVLGFIVLGVGAIINITAAIILTVISLILGIIVYKKYGGKMDHDSSI